MSLSLRQRIRHGIQLYPVTAGALVALVIASVALGLVLAEQKEGRKRDKAAAAARVQLQRQDRLLAKAIAGIQSSRKEAVVIGCKTNKSQNRVLLNIIQLSVTEARAKGQPPRAEALRKTRELLRPITPKRTQAVCNALIARVEAGPPPPP